MRFASGRLGVVLLWCTCVACGRVEQPLGTDMPEGGAPEGGANGISPGGASAEVGGRADAAGGSSGSSVASAGDGDCADDDRPTCLASCDPGYPDYYGLACVAGKWHCGPGRVDSTTCALNTPGSCAAEIAPACRESCASQTKVDPECVKGDRHCPPGSVDLNTCPADSCAQVGQALCCFPNGKWQRTTCTVEGKFDSCPEGSAATLGQCFPEGIKELSCSGLQGRACASTDLVCDDAGSCATHCACQRDLSGALLWMCEIPVC